ncbi:NADH-ubiquinone oxidoreductase B12 subunit family-domain-containing protein [Chaetomium sp. MPI-SDFR-AT-0129]|uniref:NADH-ubiquinone oxidoreductase B12 subunit family-domain-containing protein n=1 Tax=Dichotomopilus funicola TaxID=1934379 RepID=A0AAN6ZNX8_9PEZI|nr:NADH-ubiquinone oxidoreductase B12 subunit family-domain-containing protein [Chaetomium sp. MPI-SDFR-AT-0129]KAK4146300.1 NADH-ubiquinone oxidoreductase B12 subunit family-domain-containing protein [Dichotomopilus funicola]
MLPTRILLSQAGKNITGFEMRKLLAATGRPRYDPWERNEAWRYTGRFSRWNRFRRALPGFGTASVAFAVYLAYEHFFLEEEHHGEHGEGHGEHGEGHGEGKH